MALPIKPISIYVRIARTYVSHAPSLLLLAAVVFVPLGLLDAIAINVEAGPLDPANGLLSAAAAGAIVVLALTGLIGEVFYSGVVAISLTHAVHGRPPSLPAIVRRLNYRRLIAVDLIYGAVVAVGFILLIVPGVAAFVWFGLAGPEVEIEGRTVQDAFGRQLQTGSRTVLDSASRAGTDRASRRRAHRSPHWVSPPPPRPFAAGNLDGGVTLSHRPDPDLRRRCCAPRPLDLIAEKDGAPARLHSALARA